MQSKTIVKTFKSYPNMPEKLQLRLLKHIEHKPQTSEEQIEAKLLRAQMLKKQNDDAKVLKNQKHLLNVSNSYIRAIDMKSTKTQLQSEILSHKMKIAQANVTNQINEKIQTAQKLGTERVEHVKMANIVYDDDDFQRAIELSLQQMKQEKAKQIRDEIQKEKVEKAKCIYNHAALNSVIDQDLTDNQSYAEKVRHQVVLKKISSMAEKMKDRQAKAEARRQQMMDDKIQKAKDAQLKFFTGEQKAIVSEPVMEELPSAEISYSQQVRDQCRIKRVDPDHIAENLKSKQAQADARRQKVIDEKIQKAKDAQNKFFILKEKSMADEPVMVEKPQAEEPVMVERPQAEECAQPEFEASALSLEQKQKLLEEQQIILQAQLDNIKQQMSLNLAQQIKATSWTVCNKTFNRIKGSENDKI